MAKAILAVFSNPTSAEQEDEYNSWYDDVHIKELLEIPGIVSAKRYKLAGPVPADHRYLAIYEVEGDLGVVMGSLGSAPSGVSPALDAAGVRLAFWEPLA